MIMGRGRYEGLRADVLRTRTRRTRGLQARRLWEEYTHTFRLTIAHSRKSSSTRSSASGSTWA